MDYLSLLDEIEKGNLSVDKAVRKMEVFQKELAKTSAKKLKVRMKEGGRVIKVPALSLSVIKVGLKLYPSLLKFGRKYTREDIQLSPRETEALLEGIGDFLTLLKEHPPTSLISLKKASGEVEIEITTK